MVFQKNSSSEILRSFSPSRGEHCTERPGYDRMSLPRPWSEVAEAVIKYITCEGRYSTVFKYHLRILAHLRFPQAEAFSMNVPYFLLRSLNLMANSA